MQTTLDPNDLRRLQGIRDRVADYRARRARLVTQGAVDNATESEVDDIVALQALVDRLCEELALRPEP
jgi:hypothetical protein